MSTNKTPNYQLHSWTLQDDFLLREINENFSGLDAALAQGFADQLAALAQAVQQLEAKIAQGDAAQASALNTKISAANTSISSVSTRLNNLIVTGVYQGNDEDSQTISLGFTPRAVLFMLDSGLMGGNHASQGNGGLVLPGTPMRESYDASRDILAEIVTGGFTVYKETHYSYRNYSSYANWSGRPHYYLAVR